MRLHPIVGLAAALAVAGCGSYGMSTPGGIPPLQPIPTAPVMTQQLPPPLTPTPTPTPTPAEVAVAEPAMPDPATAAEIRKPDLAGGWTLSSGGESCQLFMSLTAWSGGYRANTRGCGSDELKAIGAWDLNGKEIILKDASGSPVARLYASAATRFSGQTVVSSRGVQVFR